MAGYQYVLLLHITLSWSWHCYARPQKNSQLLRTPIEDAIEQSRRWCQTNAHLKLVTTTRKKTNWTQLSQAHWKAPHTLARRWCLVRWREYCAHDRPSGLIEYRLRCHFRHLLALGTIIRIQTRWNGNYRTQRRWRVHPHRQRETWSYPRGGVRVRL